MEQQLDANEGNFLLAAAQESLRQLHEAHVQELRALRVENVALKAKLQLAKESFDSPSKPRSVPSASADLAPRSEARQLKEAHPDDDPDITHLPTRVLSKHPDDDPDIPHLPTRMLSKKSLRSTAIQRKWTCRRSSETMGDLAVQHDNSWLRRARQQRHRVPMLFEDIAPRTLNLQLLCMEKFPEEQWVSLSMRDKVELLRAALRPKHKLISPHSVFMRWWDILLAICILQVGIVTPYEVVFMGNQVSWSFFALNRLVDLVFIVDMAIQFFLVVEVKSAQWGGTLMLRDPWQLRKRYVTSWFFIDVVSIIPFDVVSRAASGPVLQRAKIMRSIKLLRLAKLLRMLRSSKIIKRWRYGIGMAFAVQKVIQFVILLLFASHWMACVWGFTGLMLGEDLCDDRGEFVRTSTSLERTSWVTTLFLGGKISPDSPCNPFAVYAASLHWATMTLTSIGYGDISPVRTEEYLVCTLSMLFGGVLWAYIIGCLCSIVTNRSLVQRTFEANTDLLNSAMREADVPRDARPKYREYLREAMAYDRRMYFSKIAGTFSPLLRQELMFYVTKNAIRSVSYFNDPNVPRAFLTSVASRLVPKFFSRGEPLDSLRHDLCLVDKGTVARNDQVLVPPSVLHEDFIILEKFKRPVTSTSLTYTQVLQFTRASLQEVLPEFPDVAHQLSRCAVKMAFCCVLLTLREARSQLATDGMKAKLSLREAFDLVFGDSMEERGRDHGAVGQLRVAPVSRSISRELTLTL